MKIDKKYKIENACSTDTSRYILNSVRIEGEGTAAQAIATDGRMMAIIPVELQEGDRTEVNISPKAFAVSRKVCGKLSQYRIELNGSAKVSGGEGEQSFGYVEGNYPNWQQVIPKKYTKSKKISFDMKLLFALWKAIGGEAASQNKVILELSENTTDPILVATEGDAKGILMPLRAA